jgi:uncharacterized protein (TIGR02147 family)
MTSPNIGITGKNFKFSEFLKSHLDDRCRRNSRYSLRAFARDLKMSPSHLSEIMNGQAFPSRDKTREISSVLGVSKSLSEKICDLLDANHSKIEWRRIAAQGRLDAAEDDDSLYYYSQDEAQYVSGIIHPSILACLEFTNPPQTPAQIGQVLGESVGEIEQALARLERIGAVEYLDDGTLVVTRTRTRVNDGVAKESVLEFHRQFSEFILTAHSHQPRTDRHCDGIVYALSKEAVPEFKKILDDAKRKLTELSRQYERKDAVYFVNLQMAEGKKTWQESIN